MGMSEAYELLKYIADRVPCATCSRSFDLDDLEVLGQRGNVWMVAVYCPHCETRGLIFARMQVQEDVRYESELEPHEWEWFESLEPISIDDVLDAHRFLRDFEGDVYDLLGMRRVSHYNG